MDFARVCLRYPLARPATIAELSINDESVIPAGLKILPRTNCWYGMPDTRRVSGW
jgi:hypothetical protein